MESRLRRRVLLVSVLVSLFVCSLSAISESQGIQQSPYSGSGMVRGGFPGGLFPSNPLGLPGSSVPGPRGFDSLYLSEGMLPLIPNLQFGYLYNFGNTRVSSGRFTADYLLPLSLSQDSMVFGEAHTEFQDFWNTLKSTFTGGTTTTTQSGFNNRVDLSFGGGFRTFLGRDTLLGVNGFYDTSRLGGTWYSSGSVGFEMASLVTGNDALDMNFNWYGQLFNSTVIQNAFRYGPSNFDFQAGYSHELWNGGPDFRLSATGYKFDTGNSVYGWNAGAELKSRDGVLVLKYDVGNDKVNQTYHTVGGFVNVGFQLENLVKGESPFTMPEPIFKSPRTLRYMLTQKVRRNWHQSTAAVVTRDRGSNGGLNRFLASIPMVGTVWPHVYESDGPNLIILFDQPAPYALLDPAKFITVELTYEFDQAPTGGTADWNIFVVGSFGWIPFNFTQPTRAVGQSGHIVFLMDSGQPDYPQAAFTSTGVDPIGIGFQVGAAGTTWLKITDVTIHFNM